MRYNSSITSLLNLFRKGLMTNKDLYERIGQMIVLGFRGYSIDEAPKVKWLLSHGKLGGVILFDYDVASDSPRRNIESPSQLSQLSQSIKELSQVPPFIAIDEEGGQVTRLKSKAGFTEFRSHKALGDTGHPEATYREATRMAYHLKEVGVNLNFAPCVDLAINTESPIINQKERSFSDDPDTVVKHAERFIQAHNEHQIVTSLKHFPGHGSAGGDTHLGMVDVTGDWRDKELYPFQMLIDKGLTRIVMVSHIFNPELDPIYPASLSKNIVTNILRKEMGYTGVVISDDLQMNAITQHFGFKESIALAINAGVDILLLGNNLQYDPELPARTFKAFKELLNSGRITEEQITRSYQRISQVKNWLK